MPEALRSNPPGRNPGDRSSAEAKAELRARIRSGRQLAEAAEAGHRRTAAALELSRGHRTIALYCSVGAEPDSWPLIDTLFGAGHTVLLPVLGRRRDGSVRHDPDWVAYAGRSELRTGYAGIAEPTGEALGAKAVRAASLIWCAALAATPSGDRLGTGGGWYDRALTHASPNALVGVLLRDNEVLDEVPVEPFDRPIDLIVTESRIIHTIRPAGRAE